MISVQPSPSYDANNESQFRSQVQIADLQNVKSTQPITSLVWIDETDGKPYRVTLQGGAFVFDEVTP